MKREVDKLIIDGLKKQLLELQKNKLSEDLQRDLDLGEMESAFPGKVFPRAAIHELISTSSESAVATNGFVSVVLEKLMEQGGFSAWIGNRASVFPPALKMFGISPDRILFIDTRKSKDTLWVLEEALKCEALVAVVGEIAELNFEESRRLQLAAERSQVTGFIHRRSPKTKNPVSCVSRWEITSLASITPEGMPGVGFPSWNVRLSKVRNGRTGEWEIQWLPQGLHYVKKQKAIAEEIIREIA